jgi:hypothetical protein
MTDDEKLEFLAGQVHALVGFAPAVITSHPNLGVLARHLEKVGQINSVSAETSLASDAYVEGVRNMQDRLKAIVEMASAQQKGPGSE